jgi:phage antirepressor YoqD-like protein
MRKNSKNGFFTIKQAIPMIDFPYGRTKFFKWLRDEKILQKDGTPYREFINRGLLDYQIVKVPNKNISHATQPLLTVEGIAYLKKLIKKRFPKNPICPKCENIIKNEHEKECK